MGEFGLTGWSNSCFWFRRTGNHESVFPKVAAAAKEIQGRHDDGSQLSVSKWNPDTFTALCQKAVANRYRERG